MGAEKNQLCLIVNTGLHGDPKNFSTFFLQSNVIWYPQGPQELVFLFLLQQDVTTLGLPGWQAAKEMEFIKRQGRNVCQCIAVSLNHFCNKRSLITSSDFQFSLPHCCCCPQIEHVEQDLRGSMLPHPESLALNIFSQHLCLVIKHHSFKFRNFVIESSLETDLRKHSLVACVRKSGTHAHCTHVFV